MTGTLRWGDRPGASLGWGRGLGHTGVGRWGDTRERQDGEGSGGLEVALGGKRGELCGDWGDSEGPGGDFEEVDCGTVGDTGALG